MGQKCNPTGLRIGVIKNWDSRWYAKKGEFADTLVEDYNLRKYLLKTLHQEEPVCSRCSEDRNRAVCR